MLSRATAVVAALACAGTASADNIARAFYEDPTSRYAHGVLGDDIEYGSLILETDGGTRYRLELPFERVFEDTAPRLFDVDGDGENEVIVVESHSGLGARLAIYDTETRVSVTSYIGQPFRWLAPVGIGAADLDGDGVIELAFVDRRHLAKTLRVFKFREGRLLPAGDMPGVTNHRIGEEDIAGGIRDCGNGPEMIVADANWREVLAVTFDGVGFKIEPLGPHEGRESFAKAMDCK